MTEHCTDCEEYDQKSHSCPKYCKVITETVKELREESIPMQWIPVSERMPSYGEDVLLSLGGFCNVGHLVATNDEETDNWYYAGWYHTLDDVEAWMPLPEPYEVEE